MSDKQPPQIPKNEDGTYDKEAVKAMFMASDLIDWTRFAESNQWDPHYTRREFPVRTWQDEKKAIIAEKQGDIIAAMVFERKYKWTRDILDTLDRYPKLIDRGTMIAEAKMQQLADLYREYVDWKKEGNHLVKSARTGKVKRVYHPWEKLPMMEINFLLKGLKEVTDAKMKALMLDKWAERYLKIEKTELEPPPENSTEETGAIITIEGKKTFDYSDIQRWFDEFADKPAAEPPAPPPPPKPIEAAINSGAVMLDDQGREITQDPNG